jgi:carbamoyltransferase
MVILGISTSHNSSAALMVDGIVVGALQEERFTKIKNQTGFPLYAATQLINFHLKKDFKKIDEIVVAGKIEDPFYVAIDKYSSRISIRDHIQEMHDVWYPHYYGEKIDIVKYWQEIIKSGKKINQNHNFDFDFLLKEGWNHDDFINHYNQVVIPDAIRDHLNFSGPITAIDHHECHSYYALYGFNISENKKKESLIVTADAFGDGANYSVSIVNKDGKIVILDKGSDNTVARVYKFTTLILGMKPNEHEYKVMGLSAYSKPSQYVQEVEDIFFDILDFIDGEFINKNPLIDSYFDLRDRLEGCRFDSIATGLQNWSTKVICKWIDFWLKETNKKGVCFSGGLSMNIKTNADILKMNSVGWLSVPGSGGDESNSIGACFAHGIDIENSVQALNHIYLGGWSKGFWGERLSETDTCEDDFFIFENVKTKDIAKILSCNYVIARCVDSAEFGARSLGNRAILANPSSISNVKLINDVIKNRDFWMPFTPSILSEHVNEYIINPKKVVSPFMTIGFDSVPNMRDDIIGGLHQGDFSARPQFVDKKTNQCYWELINEFYKITGIPALLNTSLNLHGEPMNYDLADAVRTLALSKLDLLQMPDNRLLCKKHIKSKILEVIKGH